jgi:hypothetical protein
MANETIANLPTENTDPDLDTGYLPYDEGAGAQKVLGSTLAAKFAAAAPILEAVDDRVASLLVAGDNVTLTYDDTAGTLTIDAEGGGGGGGSDDAILKDPLEWDAESIDAVVGWALSEEEAATKYPPGTTVLIAGGLVTSGSTNIDGGTPSSTYGGTTAIDGGSP